MRASSPLGFSPFFVCYAPGSARLLCRSRCVRAQAVPRGQACVQGKRRCGGYTSSPPTAELPLKGKPRIALFASCFMSKSRVIEHKTSCLPLEGGGIKRPLWGMKRKWSLRPKRADDRQGVCDFEIADKVGRAAPRMRCSCSQAALSPSLSPPQAIPLPCAADQ